MQIDEIDKMIYRELEKDGRSTISNLSAKVGLSMPAVSERVRRLESEGYIGGFTITPGEKIKNAYPVAIQSMIKLEKVDKWDSFQAFLDKQDYVTWYGTTTGRFDFVVHIMARDTNHLEKILREITAFPVVTDMESNLLLKQKNKNTANYL